MKISVAEPDSGSGSEWKKVRIREKYPGSYFLQLINNFWVKNRYLNSLLRIRGPELLCPGSGLEKIDSGINIPDRQHLNHVIIYNLQKI